MKNIISGMGGIIAVGFLIWGMYWLVKTGSYFFFYEIMVQDTIREMVRPEYLR